MNKKSNHIIEFSNKKYFYNKKPYKQNLNLEEKNQIENFLNVYKEQQKNTQSEINNIKDKKKINIQMRSLKKKLITKALELKNTKTTFEEDKKKIIGNNKKEITENKKVIEYKKKLFRNNKKVITENKKLKGQQNINDTLKLDKKNKEVKKINFPKNKPSSILNNLPLMAPFNNKRHYSTNIIKKKIIDIKMNQFISNHSKAQNYLSSMENDIKLNKALKKKFKTLNKKLKIKDQLNILPNTTKVIPVPTTPGINNNTTSSVNKNTTNQPPLKSSIELVIEKLKKFNNKKPIYKKFKLKLISFLENRFYYIKPCNLDYKKFKIHIQNLKNEKIKDQDNKNKIIVTKTTIFNKHLKKRKLNNFLFLLILKSHLFNKLNLENTKILKNEKLSHIISDMEIQKNRILILNTKRSKNLINQYVN